MLISTYISSWVGCEGIGCLRVTTGWSRWLMLAEAAAYLAMTAGTGSALADDACHRDWRGRRMNQLRISAERGSRLCVRQPRLLMPLSS
uniref:Uncharacterized protein n=1 Tax=Arundo donax TaxID=35708 RepID=A0A0A9TGC6_ARUDO